jgi:phospholipid/cholesterol/gamma-HCH transport system substrate-binding protein
MSNNRATFIKFAAFAVVMVVLSAFLVLIFGQYRTGTTAAYSAVFANVSELKSGNSVRVAGVRVGTVGDIWMRPDHKVVVEFDADRDVVLSSGTKAAVRYLNLVGDRYLELMDGPGSTRKLSGGSQIPADHTEPALDLDLLLGGLKPVIQGLNPKDVNALTSSVLQVFQGKGGTLASLLSHTSSFSTALADNNQVLEHLIDNLNTVVATLAKDDHQFGATIDRLEQLISGLAADRDPIGTAIDSLSKGTASVADLLRNARAPLKGTVEQLNRLAPLLDGDKGQLDAVLQKLPEDYRKMARVGAYGSFLQYYICGITVRVTDLKGRTAVFPWIKQEGGRCAEPHA